MTFSTAWRESCCEYDRRRFSGNALPQRIFGRPILAGVMLACAWIVWTNLYGTGADQAVETQSSPPAVASADALRPRAANAYARLAGALNAYARRATALNSTIALFDARWMGSAPGTFVKSVALRADSGTAAPTSQSAVQKTLAASPTLSRAGQIAQSAAATARQLLSLPTRAASLRGDAPAKRAIADRAIADTDTGADQPSIFERLFGKPAPLTLAYASPDDGGLSDGHGIISGQYDRQTAVYDISAHTVYLPDGTKLEAHSGLGSRIDDPRHTDERMRGSTPVNIYDLKLREAPFHGVQALRLVPVDEERVFGRSGLLAHTYMLGSSGQSFGCVSFKNYNAFLQAYLRHEIKRLVVVAHLD